MNKDYYNAIVVFKQVYNLILGIPFVHHKQDFKHFERIRKGGYDGAWNDLIVKFFHWWQQDDWCQRNGVKPFPNILEKFINNVLEYSKSKVGDRPYR